MANGKKKARNYLVAAFSSLLTIAIVQGVWPGVIPFETFAAWRTKGSVADWLIAGWPILAWGFGLQSLILLVHWNDRFMSDRFDGMAPGQIFAAGAIISVKAGVLEEIAFRWLIFYAQIVWMKVGNFLIFGFLGFGVGCFLHLNLVGPIANVMTLGGLHAWLFHPAGWAVGAAIIATNGFFRDGHAYQGWFGLVNSWFAGMFLFWMMFTYGLPAAILIHFLYDFIIFSLVALFAAIRR